MEKNDYGERISRETAKKIIDNRQRIMGSITPVVLDVIKKGELDQDTTDSISFLTKDYNGFVFSKDLLDELFKLQLSDGSSPKYLLVALGASDEGHDMAPTVIIAPCKAEKDAEGKLLLLSVNDALPGGETPPFTILKTGLPGAGNDKSIQFNLI